MTANYNHKKTSVSLINYHFVWTPKRRRKVLVGNVELRLKELILETAAKLNCFVLAVDVMPDEREVLKNEGARADAKNKAEPYTTKITHETQQTTQKGSALFFRQLSCLQ